MAAILSFFRNLPDDLYAALLTVTGVHQTMDMSVGNISRRKRYLLGDELKRMEGKELSTMECCGSVRLLEVTPDQVKVAYKRKEYEIPVGEHLELDHYLLDNPYLSREEVWTELTYERANVGSEFSSLLSQLQEHDQQYGNVSNKFAAERSLVLELIQWMVQKRRRVYFPLYALLAAAPNWHTLIIQDAARFAELMKKYLADSSDSGQDDPMWLANLEPIFWHNSPAQIFAAVPALKTLLEDRLNAGSETARKLLDRNGVYVHLGPRQNPDDRELLVWIKGYDLVNKDQPEYLWRVFPLTDLKEGMSIDMEKWGEVTVQAVGKEEVTVCWAGKTQRVLNNVLTYSIDAGNPAPLDYAYGYKPTFWITITLDSRNLWAKTKHMIETVPYYTQRPYLLSPPEVVQLRNCALRCLEILIERGDTALKGWYDQLSQEEDWSEEE